MSQLPRRGFQVARATGVSTRATVNMLVTIFIE